MSPGEFEHHNRRAFLAGCATPLLLPWRTLADAAQQDAPITLERVVDAYLDGNLRLAVRLLEIPSDDIRKQADDTFKRWLTQALPIRPMPGEADDSADLPTPRAAGGHLRRATVRRLQGTAALVVEILLPLSIVGGHDNVRAFEAIAIDALGHAARFENLDLVPQDPAGRRPTEISRALAHFRARWYVAFLQVLVNQQRRRDVLVAVTRIKLPPDDTAALAEMRFLRGLLEESVVRFNLADRRSNIWATEPSSTMISLGKRYDKASDWYRQALVSRPDHLEARLHLGRLALEGGRHAQALEMLAPLDVPAVAPAWRGLACLFMAESHAGSGDQDAARRGFEQAAEIAEVRQAALVALTLMALRDGQLADATDVTKALDVTDDPTDDSADAWTAYVSGRRANHDAVLALMREVLWP